MRMRIWMRMKIAGACRRLNRAPTAALLQQQQQQQLLPRCRSNRTTPSHLNRPLLLLQQLGAAVVCGAGRVPWQPLPWRSVVPTALGVSEKSATRGTEP